MQGLSIEIECWLVLVYFTLDYVENFKHSQLRWIDYKTQLISQSLRHTYKLVQKFREEIDNYKITNNVQT